jgi:hypothetical protein
LESAYQERLKHGLVKVDDLAENISYLHIFSPFEDILGRDKVTIRLFDASALHEGNVVADFAVTWDIELDRTRLTRENEALSQEAVKLLYMYRLVHPHFRNVDEKIIELLSHLIGDKFQFHSSVFRRAANIHPADIEWASERLHASMEEDLSIDDDQAIKGDADMFVLRPDTIAALSARLDIAPSTVMDGPIALAEALSRYGDRANGADR